MRFNANLFGLSLVVALAVQVIFVECFNENEKTVRPKGKVDKKCLDLLTNTNKTQLERCDFFKCFEERFSCGNKFWIMNWGYKYCRRYADQKFIDQFTPDGKTLLSYINQCLPSKLEKFYKSKRSIRCKTLSNNMFEAQGKCYEEIQKTFCKAFPENSNLFMNILDQSDLMNMDSFSMIKKVADQCEPKIDFFSLG